MCIEIEQALLEEAQQLKETFTLYYPHGLYKEERYSSTYDELSKWLRKTITYLKSTGSSIGEDPFLTHLHGFRGKIGNIDGVEFQKILDQLEKRFQQEDPGSTK